MTVYRIVRIYVGDEEMYTYFPYKLNKWSFKGGLLNLIKKSSFSEKRIVSKVNRLNKNKR